MIVDHANLLEVSDYGERGRGRDWAAPTVGLQFNKPNVVAVVDVASVLDE